MGTPDATHRVKLVTGLIFREEAAAQQAVRLLVSLFGPLDFTSPAMEFSGTSYYRQEMGEPLHRIFISHQDLVPQDSLAEIKTLSIGMETQLSPEGKRAVNIDPGYLTQAKFILATTKDFSHRVYLGKGIYAELTYIFKKHTFLPLEWTYPDYRLSSHIDLFNRIRTIYETQTKTR